MGFSCLGIALNDLQQHSDYRTFCDPKCGWSRLRNSQQVNNFENCEIVNKSTILLWMLTFCNLQSQHFQKSTSKKSTNSQQKSTNSLHKSTNLGSQLNLTNLLTFSLLTFKNVDFANCKKSTPKANLLTC